MNNLRQGVDARPDITLSRLLLGIRVKELPTIGTGIRASVAAPMTQRIATLVWHIIL